MPAFKSDNALLLTAKPLGERSFLLSVLTKENGRFQGVLKAKKAPQPGSFLSLRWQARLSEQLGTFYLDESRSFYASFLDDKIPLYILSSACSLLNEALPERQNAEQIFDLTLNLFHKLDEPDLMKNYLLWEGALLKSLGFGMDLSACAGGGDPKTLAYVSPKTGRAVSLEKGLPFADKLLPLPRFLWHEEEKADNKALLEAYTLTTYFLTVHMGLNRLPPMREQLFHLLKKGGI